MNTSMYWMAIDTLGMRIISLSAFNYIYQQQTAELQKI